MPDIFDLIARWWKYILGFVIVVLIATAIFVYTAPKKYLGQATALPAPTYATDKAGVFSDNLQILYPGLGTSDDLDMILGTAHLDTVYTAVAADVNLADYFGIDKGDIERNKKAGSILKEKSKVLKSDYGDLKVKVWYGDRQKAAEMANAIMDKLQQIQQDVQTANNAAMLAKIKEAYAAKELEFQKLVDSSNNSLSSQIVNARRVFLMEQIQQYEKLQNEYQLMVNAKPQALIIVERATAALWPDKPKPKESLIAAAVLSLIFGLLATLVLERRRMVKA